MGGISMTQMKDLTNAQKVRIFSFMAIALVQLIFILAFAWNTGELTDQIPYTDSCNVDGSDFSPAANLCVAGFNGIVNLITMIFSIGITWFVATVSLIAWRFIAIQKTSVVAETEWKIAKYTWFAFIAVSLLGCLIILHFSHLTFCTFLTALPILLLWLLGVLPLQNRYRNWKETSIEP